MAREAHETYSYGNTMLLPLAAIRRARRPWHTRIVVPDSAIERLAQAIRATGRVVPITVVEVAPDTYEYVVGLIRMLALERLGHTHVPAHVLDAADEEMSLLMAISEQEAQLPLTLLERGWALQRLRCMRAKAGRPVTQAQLAAECGMDKGDISLLLRAAAAIPADRAEESARVHGLAMQDIVRLPREVLRHVCRAPAEQQDRLLRAACAELKTRESRGGAARGARTAAAAQAARGARTATAAQAARAARTAAAAQAAPQSRWSTVARRILAGLRHALAWFRHSLRAWRKRLPW
jgi:ParB-like chromosome segregation protein Spo0J